MYWTYTKTYFLNNTTNSTVFSKNFISFFQKPVIALKNPEYTKKHTKFLKENINKKIEHSFFTYKKNSGHNPKIFTNIWLGKESFIHFLPVTFTVKKILIAEKTAHKKQFFFILKEIICGIHITQKSLLKETIILKDIFLENKEYFSKENFNGILFYQNFLAQYFFNITVKVQQPLKNKASTTIFFEKIFPIIFQTYFATAITKKIINYSPNNFLTILTPKYIRKNKNSQKNILQAKIFSFLKGRLNIKNSIKNFFIRKIFNPNVFVWKKINKNLNENIFTGSTIKKNYFPLIRNKQFNFNNNIVIKQQKTRYKITAHILYLLLRLEEKIDLYNKNPDTKNFAQEILKLYNTLQHFIIQKQDNSLNTGIILSNVIEILKIKNTEWKFLFLHAVNAWLQNPTTKSTIKTQHFFNRLWNKIESLNQTIKSNKKTVDYLRPQLEHKINSTINILAPVSKQKNYQTTLNVRKFLTNEKLVLANTKYNFKNNKVILTKITKRPVKIFFINALSLTKFAFNLERVLEKKEKRSPTLFLQNIDRDLINKYKYIAIYIKDLIRICFIGMYLKKANVIAQFIAFQLGKLPRNRKETSFIRFIIKVVKTFAAEREEILGLRIKFSGRVNRWRRTKAIIGERGVIPLHTMQNQIEYGTSHAVNRKGAVGIKIWIHYNPTFNTTLKESILKYFNYSKRLAIKKKFLKTTYFIK